MAKALRWRWIDAVHAAECPLTSTERAVAIAHGLHADDDGANCYPGAYLIASETAFNVKTVEKVRANLVKAGWLVCEYKGGAFKGGTRQKSEYRLRIPIANRRPVDDIWADEPPADDGWSEQLPPAHDDEPPADDATTTRQNEALPTKDQPVTNPAPPPAVDGWSPSAVQSLTECRDALARKAS